MKQWREQALRRIFLLVICLWFPEAGQRGVYNLFNSFICSMLSGTPFTFTAFAFGRNSTVTLIEQLGKRQNVIWKVEKNRRNEFTLKNQLIFFCYWSFLFWFQLIITYMIPFYCNKKEVIAIKLSGDDFHRFARVEVVVVGARTVRNSRDRYGHYGIHTATDIPAEGRLKRFWLVGNRRATLFYTKRKVW